MKRILIISNRLPVSITKSRKGINVKPSVGGLATGMKSIYKEMDGLWIGWPGIDNTMLTGQDENIAREKLREERCEPLYIDSNDIDLYYYGFSNKTIWPLFHYFPQFTLYKEQYWKTYEKVNKLFADKVCSLIHPEDLIWIHDYHLLLLPKLIKDHFPEVTIGFFNHIPFPSYELFRLLPWRKQILEGMLGADLIGFHTYDYERHFNSCVRRLFGYDYEMNRFNLGNRIIKVDNFPMGIDYQKFHLASKKLSQIKKGNKPNLQEHIQQFYEASPGRKLILSIDRMDYTKGIPNRLYAFQRFLEKYPEFRGRVSLIMLAVPSRSKVGHYQMLKKQVDELVGKINGRFGDLNWTPVWYFYRSMSFEHLILLYKHADIGLLTPLRDGMNLVAKEFIASKTNGRGVLILSEMAGAVKEMHEAIRINPNNLEEIADAINKAILMPVNEQVRRNRQIQERLRRYSIEKWAYEFVRGMTDIRNTQQKYISKKINSDVINAIERRYSRTRKGILFLDYNGTLVSSKKDPEYAAPDEELHGLLDKFSERDNIELVLMSSRDKDILEKWFGRHNISLLAEHGMWEKTKNKGWHHAGKPLRSEWKRHIKPVIVSYVDRTPGTYLEEMNHVLSWHYEKADPDHGIMRANELKDELALRIMNMDLQILEGNKVIEIKPAAMNKGIAALNTMEGIAYDFIMAVGDDWTDEYLFELLPDTAITLRVGLKKTRANYTCESHKDVRNLLNQLSRVKSTKNRPRNYNS